MCGNLYGEFTLQEREMFAEQDSQEENGLAISNFVMYFIDKQDHSSLKLMSFIPKIFLVCCQIQHGKVASWEITTKRLTFDLIGFSSIQAINKHLVF